MYLPATYVGAQGDGLGCLYGRAASIRAPYPGGIEFISQSEDPAFLDVDGFLRCRWM